ncbi:MAG: alkaline phosphatase family protein, partial [Candidatus Krumholzibacteria bacterium]|nr:alkaline phosphatase family protein [Candidatus Krumholzibacteria bacterium]
RRMKRAKQPVRTDVPGVLFLEIDGLSEAVLRKAIAGGYMPTMARWINGGSHRIVGWECDLSSQTSASQAGILHGNNRDIVAFRWYDRKRGRIMASSDSSVLRLLEEERSDGNGLLARDGASRGNMFSGDAPSVMYTGSTLRDLSRLHARDFYAFFVSPYNFSRTLILSIGEIILEKYQFWKTRAAGVRPRLGRDVRGGLYPLIRAVVAVFMRDLTVYTLIGDIYAGVSSAYATFAGYDEVAHHSGVESHDALRTLSRLDRKFRRLEEAARGAPRPYRFVVLSDHGQCNGETFKQRYGTTLEGLVQNLVTDGSRVRGSLGTDEDWGHINAFLTEAIHHQRSAMAGPLRNVVRRRIDREGRVVLGPEADPRKRSDPSGSEREVVVLASGNLGLIYFPGFGERLDARRVEELYPGLIAGLAAHEGIGFAMVGSEERGPIVIGRSGVLNLGDGSLEGEDPLKGYGNNAADHLRRSDRFSNVPDILVVSVCVPERNEVAAFEELIGSHGGLGGEQARPFLAVPSRWRGEQADLIGAEAVHRQLKNWLDAEQDGAA